MAEETRSSAPGGRCGNYALGERIAVGGMAEVYHATPIEGRSDEPIVLKRMLPELATNKDFVAMFVEEARISTRLDHPNIVQVRDFEATDRGLFLVMELVDGPDLSAVLSRCAKLERRIEPEVAVYVACHILEALDYAHGAATPNGEHLRVVHRDVSPSNVLLTRRGHVKLADFGIARAASLGRTTEVASGTLKGKFGYMSPEQVRGDNLDGRSDVFSMGIVLAEMLMSRRLFAAPDDVELLLLVRHADLRRLDQYGGDLPADLLAIVRKALARDRNDRYAKAGDFRDALVEWLETSGRRSGAGKLAGLLRDLEREGGDLCTWARGRDTQKSSTMSGKQTVMARAAMLEAAQRGRQAFDNARPVTGRHQVEEITLGRFDGSTPRPGAEAGAPQLARTSTPPPMPRTTPPPTMARASTAPPETSSRPSPTTPPPMPRRSSAPSTPPRTYTGSWAIPLASGELGQVTVVDLLCEIARDRRSGALAIHSDDQFKEAYFRAGQPVFVRCNSPDDRFGEYLVRRGVITRNQLDRALGVLDHFQGRLGQALVSLGLIEPVDAVRLLAAQVTEKLYSACQLRAGTYEFRDNEVNPWPALELQLSIHEVIGRGMATIPTDALIFWAERMHDRRAMIAHSQISALGLEPRIIDRLEILDGHRTIGSVLDALPGHAERFLVMAGAYVAWRCGLLRFAKG